MKKTSYQKLKAENKRLNDQLTEMKSILNGDRDEEIQRFFKGLRTQEEANKFPKHFGVDRGNDYYNYPERIRRESDIQNSFNTREEEKALNGISPDKKIIDNLLGRPVFIENMIEEERVKLGNRIIDEVKAVQLVKEGKMTMSELLKMDIKTKGFTPILDFLQEINYNAFYPNIPDYLEIKEEDINTHDVIDRFMDKMNNMPAWQIKRPHIKLIHPDDIEEEINEAIDQKEEPILEPSPSLKYFRHA